MLLRIFLHAAAVAVLLGLAGLYIGTGAIDVFIGHMQAGLHDLAEFAKQLTAVFKQGMQQ